MKTKLLLSGMIFLVLLFSNNLCLAQAIKAEVGSINENKIILKTLESGEKHTLIIDDKTILRMHVPVSLEVYKHGMFVQVIGKTSKDQTSINAQLIIGKPAMPSKEFKRQSLVNNRTVKGIIQKNGSQISIKVNDNFIKVEQINNTKTFNLIKATKADIKPGQVVSVVPEEVKGKKRIRYMTIGTEASLRKSKSKTSASEKRPVKPAVDWIDDFAKAIERVTKEDKPMLVYFHSPEVASSKTFEQSILKNKEFELSAKAWVCCSLDIKSNKNIAQKLGVFRVPTIVLLTNTGKTINSYSGNFTKQTLIEEMNKQGKN